MRMRVSFFIRGQGGGFHCCLLSLCHSPVWGRQEGKKIVLCLVPGQGTQSPCLGILRLEENVVFKICSTTRLTIPLPPPIKKFIQKIYKKESEITIKKSVKHKRRQ